MASPTSWLGISAAPPARTASSTRCASCCSASSSTGLPWQARRTPLTTLSRLNCSVTPDRLTTASTIVSDVVNRRPQDAHERRLRIAWPSSTSRESTTRESACQRNGHLIRRSPSPPRQPPRSTSPGHHAWPCRDHPVPLHLVIDLWTSGG